MVVGRYRGDGRLARERDEADAEPVRDPIEERLRRGLRGLEPRGGDVVREHRPRGVDHQDDGRVLDGHDAVHVWTGEREAEQAEDGEEQPADHPLAPARERPADGAQHLDVRESDRVTRTALAEEHEAEDERRQDCQGEERERTVEAQAIATDRSVLVVTLRATRQSLRWRP